MEDTLVEEAPVEGEYTGPKVETTIDKPAKVTIRSCRKSEWLPEDHDGSERYTGTSESLTVQNERGTRNLITGLTEELETYFEGKLSLPGKKDMPGGTLSKYNMDFWSKFSIKIPKGGKVLNLSNPQDELEWYVLKAHTEVANSEADRANNAFARYVLTSEEEQAEEVNKTVRVKRQAYNKFGDMNTTSMKGFLKVYSRLYNTPQTITEDSSPSFVEAAIGTIIEDKPQLFLDVMQNEDYKTMLFLENCIEANIIKKEKTKYFLQGGDMLGSTLETTIDYLKDVNNQDVVLTLKSQLAANS